MHTINELKDRLLSDLKEIAEQLNVGNFKRLSKQDLIYKILDQQALVPSEGSESAPAAPAPVAAAPAAVAAPRPPAKAASRRPAPSTSEQPFSDVAPPAPSRPAREPRREAVAVEVAVAPEATVEIFDSIEGLALVPANHATGAALANEPVPQLPPEPVAEALNGSSADATTANAARPDRPRRERVDRAGRPITEQRAAEMAAEKVAAEAAAAEAAANPTDNGAEAREGSADSRRRDGGSGFGDRRDNRDNRADRFERDNREARDPREQRPARNDQPRENREPRQDQPRENREPRQDQPRNGQDRDNNRNLTREERYAQRDQQRQQRQQNPDGSPRPEQAQGQNQGQGQNQQQQRPARQDLDLVVPGGGTFEMMADGGYGFLRSPYYNTSPRPTTFMCRPSR